MGAFDVLEHLENPELLLREIYRVLTPGGIFVCSVPAYQWLFSDFDVSIGHFRRYSRVAIQELLESAGFQSIEVVSRFSFLVFPALVLRRLPYLLGRRRKFGTLNKSNNPARYFQGSIKWLMQSLVKIETRLKIRFGLSIIVLAKKP
jgi:SAM-dependent methyltransferase